MHCGDEKSMEQFSQETLEIETLERYKDGQKDICKVDPKTIHAEVVA